MFSAKNPLSLWAKWQQPGLYPKNRIKLACLRYLFEKCDIAESELVMLLEPVKE